MSLPVTDSVPTHSENSIANMTPFKERSSNDKIIVESSQPRGLWHWKVSALKRAHFWVTVAESTLGFIVARLAKGNRKSGAGEIVVAKTLHDTKPLFLQLKFQFSWAQFPRSCAREEDHHVARIFGFKPFAEKRNETIGWLQGLSRVASLPGSRMLELGAENLASWCFRKVQNLATFSEKCKPRPQHSGGDSSRLNSRCSTFSVVYRDNETIRNINNDRTCTMH